MNSIATFDITFCKSYHFTSNINVCIINTNVHFLYILTMVIKFVYFPLWK